MPRSMLNRLLNAYITTEARVRTSGDAKSDEIDRVFAGQTSRFAG